MSRVGVLSRLHNAVGNLDLDFTAPVSSTENNNRKLNFKWKAPSRSVGLLILENPLPLFNVVHPNRLLPTNGKHPEHKNNWRVINAKNGFLRREDM